MLGWKRLAEWLACAAIAIGLVGLASGCQFLVDAEITQCRTDDDCQGFDGAPVCGPAGVCVAAEQQGDGDASDDPRWACLGEPPLTEFDPGTVEVRFSVLNYGSFTVPEGATVKVCNVFDVPCAEPLQEGIPLDEDGFATVEVPIGFSGYFEVAGPTIVDSLLYRNRPFLTDEEFEGPAVVSPAVQNALAMGGGEDIDPDQGVIIIDVKDCDGNASAGVQFGQEGTASNEHPFYFDGALPDRDRDSTIESIMLTSDGTPRAAGGFSMVEQGYVTVFAALGPDVVGRLTVIVRPSAMTFAQIFAGY